MAEPAIRRMTVDEFLNWSDGTDSRHELVGGFVVAMAPPASPHGRLSVRLGGAIERVLAEDRPECFVQSEAGVVLPDRNDTCYIADLIASCEDQSDDNRLIREPFLIIEILSPSTGWFDRQTKVADYRRMPSVQEILLLDSESIFAEVLRREDGDRWITLLVQGPAAMLTLTSVPVSVSMAELYARIPLMKGRQAPAAPD
jgi:Uma2 family endonuclease